MNIDFEKLNDYQKTLIIQLSYVEFQEEIINKIDKTEGISIGELEKYIIGKDKNYLGLLARVVTGIKVTPKDIMKKIKEQNLENLIVKKIESNKNTSFFGMAIQDDKNNTAIIFRGTEMNNIYNILKDNLTNFREFVTDDSPQRQQALEFFRRNHSQTNYILGHSLGGNLAEHVLVEESENIKEVFVINPYSLHSETINKKEKIQEFTENGKIKCNIIGGDWVSELREHNEYENNITYIVNNNKLRRNIFSPHMLEAIEYDENRNFRNTNRDNAYKTQEYKWQRKIVKIVKNIGEKYRKLYKRRKVLQIADKKEEKEFKGSNIRDQIQKVDVRIPKDILSKGIYNKKERDEEKDYEHE